MSFPEEKREAPNILPLSVKEDIRPSEQADEPGRRERKHRLLKLFVNLIGVGFSLYILFINYYDGTAPNDVVVEQTEDGNLPWALIGDMDEAESFPHPRPPKWHHGHRILNGKPAERVFLNVPNNESAIQTSRHFAAKPHMAGTDNDFDTAIDFLHLLQKELGISTSLKDPVYEAGSEESQNATLHISSLKAPTAWVDTYYPVLNTPVNHSLEILGDNEEDVIWTANLEEIADSDLDPDATEYAEAVPAFHGLSRGGEVQGKLVYANYGRKEDFDELEEAGVDLNGTIVITRYGGIFRGLKVKGAQERGAIGCLIYSDLRDDGSVRYQNGYAAYPHGPARNPTSVQRGSVQFLSLYPGDPTTPGVPAYKDSNRTDGANIPSIPSLPISWNTASRLLQEISADGKNRTVKLVNNVDTKVTPIWNTLAVIPGHIKDEVVVFGNHRDAWVLGATDPTSGTVSMVEVVRGLGELLKKGWTPLRTILLASWDAEEYGLIGSTEWGEDFPEWIQNNVVAYLNLDSSVGGSRFSLSASPSLSHLVRGAAEDIPHPTIPDRSLWQARFDSGPLHGLVDEEAMRAWEEEHGEPLIEVDDLDSDDDLWVKVKGGSKVDITGKVVRSESTGVKPLGSGSDYTVFLQRNGIASSNAGFGPTLSDPVYHYHSVFDSQPWQEKYGDPGFHRHVAVAKHLGLQLLRLADSIVLPINSTQYALELDAYLNKVEDIAEDSSLDTDFSSLRSSIAKLQRRSSALDNEKVHAEKKLRKAIHDLAKSWHGHHPILRKVHKVLKKIKKWLGHGKDGDDEHLCTRPGRIGKWTPRIGRTPAWAKEQEANEREDEQVESIFPHPKIPHPKIPHHGHKHGRDRKKLFKKLAEAVKGVRTVNKKLVGFERGFISEDGIKDREWYRHLGVAPGKWLGYGATTFPALTEALTIEKNATLAQEEAKRLEKLIDSLSHTLKV